MDEIEVPLEQAHEHLHEAAHQSSEKWISWAALASGIIAVAAAVSALLAGKHANEAMLFQIKASNSWNYYQAKGVKAAVLAGKVELLSEMNKNVKDQDVQKIEDYKKSQEDISKEAQKMEHESEQHRLTHEIYARAVTLFQVAIAIGAISVLSRRRKFWYFSLAMALAGMFFLIQGLI